MKEKWLESPSGQDCLATSTDKQALHHKVPLWELSADSWVSNQVMAVRNGFGGKVPPTGGGWMVPPTLCTAPSSSCCSEQGFALDAAPPVGYCKSSADSVSNKLVAIFFLVFLWSQMPLDSCQAVATEVEYPVIWRIFILGSRK